MKAFADAGGPVLGVCNGFQILLEAGLLPGAMLRNRGLKFICEHVSVRVEQTDTPFTGACRQGQVLRIPISSRRGQLLRARRRARRAGTGAARDLPLRRCRERRADRRGQSERRGAQHRRHLQRAPQRRRHDAAPRAGVRADARQRRRARAVRVGRSRARVRRAPSGPPHDELRYRHPGTPRPDQPTNTTRIVARARARAVDHRARHLLGDVVRALQLQELAHPSEEAADARPARAAGARRERRRRGHRRRPGRGLQDRIAQPPLVHRALSGRGDRRRRHHPRHLHDGRAADRAAQLAALRIARRPDRCAHAPHHGRRRRRHRRLRQQHRHRRRSAARLRSRTATPAIRWST